MSDDLERALASLPERVNASPALLRIGRFCSVEFLLEVGDRPWHLKVERGRLASVEPGPFRMRAWAFAVRAEEGTWRRFWAPVPEPGFNDIFAMASRGHARIEGDVGPLLESLRYVKEVLALPRAMLEEARHGR